MTPAKKAYYEFKNETDKYHEGLVDPINDYVCELEEQKADMLEVLIEAYRRNNHWGEANYHRWDTEFENLVKKVIETVRGKSIEEALSDRS